MRTYKELVDLAMTCVKQAHITTSKDVAYELWRMAISYQQQAAHLDGGKLPDIGAKAGASSSRCGRAVDPGQCEESLMV